MRRYFAWVATAIFSLGLLITAAGPVPTTATAASTGAFSFNWTGGASAPVVWTGSGGTSTWDVLTHKRGIGEDFQTVPAQHGADCSPPPATHLISTLADSVFICRNHMMTGIADNGYGANVLTPDHMVDFSQGESVIAYNVSTQHLNARTWYDVWITPFAENMMAPLTDGVDLQGPPRTAIRIRDCECGQNSGDFFEGSIVSNFVETKLPSLGTHLQDLLPPSAVTRTRFELHISQNHLKFGVPSLGLWYVDSPISVPFNRGVVQLMAHAYDPCKGQTGPTTSCVYDTWHWSDFSISQAVPFTIINGSPRYANGQQTTVTFGAPAPASAFLRFEAVSGGLQVSYDGGHTFQTPQTQSFIGDKGAIHDDHFSPYFTPIPAGTQTVIFSGRNWWGGQWWLRDPSIWSDGGSSPVVQPPANNPPTSVPTNPATNPPTNPPTSGGHSGSGSSQGTGGGGSAEGSGGGGSSSEGSGSAPAEGGGQSVPEQLFTKLEAAINPTGNPTFNVILLVLVVAFVFGAFRVIRGG